MKKTKRCLSLVLSVLLSLFTLPIVFAQTSVQNVCKVGFFAMDGYHMIDADNIKSGYGYDFLQLVSRYTNLTFEYIGYDKNWAEIQEMLLRGEVDIVTSAQKTPERELLYDFSAVNIGTSMANLMIKAGDTRYIAGEYYTYSGMRVGMIKNNTRNERLEEFAAEKGFSFIPVYFDDIPTMTAALQSGILIDAIVTSNLRQTLNEWILDEFSSSPFYVITKKGNEALLNKFNFAITQMDHNDVGWRFNLFNRYYRTDTGNKVAFNSKERAFLNRLRHDGSVLRCTVSPDNKPYSYFEEGTAKGILPDIFAEVAARMEIPYVIIETADRVAYDEFIRSGDFDIMLDGIDHFSLAELAHYEISDVYFSTPVAELSCSTTKYAVNEIVYPFIGDIPEKSFWKLKSTYLPKPLATVQDCVSMVEKGRYSSAYMLQYTAQDICSRNVSNKFRFRIMPEYTRNYTLAVPTTKNPQLLSAVSKTLKSVSPEFIETVVIAHTQFTNNDLSFKGFVYQNPILFALIITLLIVIIAVFVLLMYKMREAAKEHRHIRLLERFIGYLCESYSKVFEVNVATEMCIQYLEHNSGIERHTLSFREFLAAADFKDIYSEDRSLILDQLSLESLRNLVEQDGEQGERYIEARLRSADGQYRWNSCLLKVIPTDTEHPCSVMILIRDIDTLRSVQENNKESLERALSGAVAANKSKTTYLSSMSHEIRTPLNAVIGYLTIAANSVDIKEKVLHCIKNAEFAAKHLLDIVNNVLEVSAMESGKLKLAHERFDFKKLITNISAIFYQQCSQKNVIFSILLDNLTEEWVVGDSMRVNQILMNLLSNAVKFTDERGLVGVNIKQTHITDSTVTISITVKDTGIGMSEEYQKRLFSPFEQENADTAKKYGGSGLGMFITKKLVTLMRGSINVQSKQGEGTTFAVELPFERTRQMKILPDKKNFSNVHVLIVDDEKSTCDYIRALLDRCGVQSMSASNGEKALNLIKVKKAEGIHFNLCIIDWNMPGINGVETAQRIHKECGDDIPVIIATAYDTNAFEDEALAAGVEKVVPKPLFQSTVFDLLMSMTEKKATSDEENQQIPDLAGMHILLAEDSDMNIEVAVTILEMAKIQVDVARTGTQAVEMFIAHNDVYNAILMDIQMPEMDGYEATRAIRASSCAHAQTVPIFAMTANAFSDDIQASINAGMNGHITKPIELEELFTVLSQCSI